ncbi:flagellar basal body-associated protein FliL [Heyndrickxia shackletonii]|uniref:Flagellar protein FliL n=1 Tax=Heyndrickxia shackletonii TaxID=157838 RepID=A0A0Q3WZ97_9BACI|nr:flagellar basal body-associated protein FliL [Heyndrickxia shackletonii]KQL54626.1 flagellar basal body-associated protein FliL [Heyndrickxia shackletonii]NEY98272.1 flagellar basal body-associated protein FliL [Heyndrickxia shackletonii]
MKNKMMRTMLILLLVILLAGAVAIIVIYKLDHTSANKAPSIDEVLKQSVDVPEITTNLKTNNFIKISFKLETDSKKAQEELTKRDFQVKNIIIDQLSEMSPNDLDGQKGKDKLRMALKDKISKIMQNGKVVNVYITSYVIQ